MLEESIKFMKERYGGITWIDHGMYNGKINRESFAADGLDSKSEFYAADLWEKYGTRYFWSSGVEIIRNYSVKEKIREGKLYDSSINFWKRYLSPKELNDLNFISGFRELVQRYRNKGELNCLNSDKGNAFPTPLFWQHPTQTRNFYSWVTDYARQVNNLSEKRVKIEGQQLDKLISDWGIFINHGYFVRFGHDYEVLSQKDGKIVINPYFDKILELMAGMRDQGDLYITTIRDLLNYWILIEKVSFDYMPDGSIYIRNGNNEQINGLSLVVHAKSVMINGEIPKFRRIGEDLIFWFDLPANQSIKMHVDIK
jgi:hypothetical protein